MIPKLMMYVGGRFPAITPPNNIGQVVIIISDFSGRNHPITFFKLTAMIRILNWNSYFFGGIILGTYILERVNYVFLKVHYFLPKSLILAQKSNLIPIKNSFIVTVDLKKDTQYLKVLKQPMEGTKIKLRISKKKVLNL